MGDRTVPERINEFLVRCAGRSYCDHCIQERLGLRWRQQVQLVTATLGVTSGYRRNMAACCTCSETKQVISFVGTAVMSFASDTLSLPKSGRGNVRMFRASADCAMQDEIQDETPTASHRSAGQAVKVSRAAET
jgi:hypothetical protein